MSSLTVIDLLAAAARFLIGVFLFLLWRYPYYTLHERKSPGGTTQRQKLGRLPGLTFGNSQREFSSLLISYLQHYLARLGQAGFEQLLRVPGLAQG